MCKITSPCPYNHQCQDCLHYELDRNGRKHQKTGISTSDMKAYKREYNRRQRARQLELEMECAGVLRG